MSSGDRHCYRPISNLFLWSKYSNWHFTPLLLSWPLPSPGPAVILKDVSYEVMAALLQFMYQGVVNVKHDELPLFMKIAASLQIKGLTAHEEPNQSKGPTAATPQQRYEKNAVQSQPKDSHAAATTNNTGGAIGGGSVGDKRSLDVHHESYPIMPKRRQHQPPQQQRLMAELLHQVQTQQQQQQHLLHQHQHHQQQRSAEGDLSSHSEEGTMHAGTNVAEDVLMPAISLTESPFQLGHPQVKRESAGESPATVENGNNNTNNNSNNNNGMERPLFHSPLKIEFGSSELQAAAAAAAAACYQMGPNLSGLSSCSSPNANDLNMSQDSYLRSANHMDIPTGE